ncbi:hypothetical protein [Bradyrhizobium elkanii]|uniref:hypothetical protein n=1 Tax=Bradyrhizobium elkanii TaxID=29448 RepID=UPI003D236D28
MAGQAEQSLKVSAAFAASAEPSKAMKMTIKITQKTPCTIAPSDRAKSIDGSFA